MSTVLTAIVVTTQMMAIFFCAFLVIYLVAVLLLPLEKGISRYIWSHSGQPKLPPVHGSFRDFSKRHKG